MSLSPSSRVSAEGVMIYSGQWCVNLISVYCHGSGESCLQNPSASFAHCWVRDNKLLRHHVLQQASFWAAVSGAGPLLCPTSVHRTEFASSVGVLIPLSLPLVMLLSPAHLSPNRSLCDVISLPTLTAPQQVFFLFFLLRFCEKPHKTPSNITACQTSEKNPCITYTTKLSIPPCQASLMDS